MPVFTSSENGKRKRLDYIDALRCLACLWVIGHHSYSSAPAPNGFLRYPVEVIILASQIGWLGVNLFLVLSGFCLFYPIALRNELCNLRVNLSVFARRRAWRILPPYYAALLLSLLWLAIKLHHMHGRWDVFETIDGRSGLLLHLFMLFNFSSDTIGSINYSFWSLALECQLYVIFPVLVWCIARFGLEAPLAGTFVISLVWDSFCLWKFGLSRFWTPELAVYYHALPGRCFEFAAGAVAAGLVARPRPNQARIALALILIAIIPATYFVSQISRFGPLIDEVWGVIFAALLVLLCEAPNVRFKENALLRVMVWIGAFSYSIYLVHAPVIELTSLPMLHLPKSPLGVLLVNCVRVIVIVGVGYVFHLLFERPFIAGWPRSVRQAEVPAVASPAPVL